MMHNTLTFNHNNTVFFGQYWQPAQIKAVVIILHGLGEHSGRFTEVATTLVSNNFGVIAFDHYGHGKTTGKRGHNPGYEYVLDSIVQFIEKSKEVFGEHSMFLYGHSMGGNAVINYMLARENELKGALVTSAFLKLAFEPPKWKLSLGKIIQKIAPSVTLDNEVDPNFISREEKEVETYKNDPLIHSKVSPNFSLAFMEKGEWAIANAHLNKKPMLLLHGTGDKLISYKGSTAFAENCESATLKLYDEAYHELHNDLCRAEVKEDIVNWLNQQL